MIQVYTGNGKGKTTAAIGQGIRCIGYNKKVHMVQFLKGGHTGELVTLKKLEPLFKVFRFEKERGFTWTLNDTELLELKEEILNAWEFVKQIIKNKECDMLILDEILAVLNKGYIDTTEAVSIFKQGSNSLEIILTGRDAKDAVIEIADYVSEIVLIKHPINKCVYARENIEY